MDRIWVSINRKTNAMRPHEQWRKIISKIRRAACMKIVIKYRKASKERN